MWNLACSLNSWSCLAVTLVQTPLLQKYASHLSDCCYRCRVEFPFAIVRMWLLVDSILFPVLCSCCCFVRIACPKYWYSELQTCCYRLYSFVLIILARCHHQMLRFPFQTCSYWLWIDLMLPLAQWDLVYATLIGQLPLRHYFDCYNFLTSRPEDA